MAKDERQPFAERIKKNYVRLEQGDVDMLARVVDSVVKMLKDDDRGKELLVFLEGLADIERIRETYLFKGGPLDAIEESNLRAIEAEAGSYKALVRFSLADSSFSFFRDVWNEINSCLYSLSGRVGIGLPWIRISMLGEITRRLN